MTSDAGDVGRPDRSHARDGQRGDAGAGLFGQQGSTSALSPLVPSLVGKPGMVAAALLLHGYEGELKPEYLIAALAPAFTDDDPQVFRDALEVLGIDPDVLAHLVGSLVYLGVAIAQRWAAVDPTVDVGAELRKFALYVASKQDGD